MTGPDRMATRLDSERSEMNLALRLVRSSLGSKYIMALTGLALIGFVLAHMSGNLLIYAGRDALNSYAAALKDRPALLWAARLVLLALFVLHIVLGIRLTRQNIGARPIGYAYESTLQANWASRHMLLTGLVVLRLHRLSPRPLHLRRHPGRRCPDRVSVGRDESNKLPRPHRDTRTRHEVVAGFAQGETDKGLGGAPGRVRHGRVRLQEPVDHPDLHLVSMVFLGLHLRHGGSSWFQSLGLSCPSCNAVIRGFGPGLAILVVAGNCSIPLSVLLGIVK